MNLNDLTIGQAKELAALFNGVQASATSPMIGRKCVVRTYSAGVHFGTVAAHDGKQVLLTDTRRIYYWENAFTLSAVAKHGISGDCKISCMTAEILLTEAVELIPMTDKAEKNLYGQSVHLGDKDDD